MIAWVIWSVLCVGVISEKTEEEGLKYMEQLNKDAARQQSLSSFAEWEYTSNLTEETLAKKLQVSLSHAMWSKKKWEKTIQYPWKTFKDDNLKRQFKKFSVLGADALSEDKYKELMKIISSMEETYSTTTLCDYKNKEKCDLQLDPDLTQILANGRDPDELKHVWLMWRNQIGPKCKQNYTTYVNLSNEAARANNFSSNTEFWLENFEDPQFTKDIDNLWKQLQPLYLQLHAYVREKLRARYGDNVVPKQQPIPAHLLGNMWAQTWSNIFDIIAPFPDIKSVDVSPQLKQQGYTPLKMFKMAEEFFTSINLTAMPESFWKDSIIEKPTDRKIVCHPSAWDFYNGEDFRIKMCTTVNMDDLITIHHEMGHIEYDLQYKDQPVVFREGANSGFHEAVGDVIALSVSTVKHLKEVGLLDSSVPSTDEKSVINHLLYIALDKIPFLPFAYIMDLWRWDVFSGKTNPDKYNCHWWDLRLKYQGLQPPTDRSEHDFDPAAKYHIVADVPYIRYFVSFVIQFQFHKALCEKAGQYEPGSKPLYDCDIYKSKEAGTLLKRMLAMGSSKPWPEAMKVITGQSKMDAGPLMEYFDPLVKWLEKENARLGSFIGWEDPTYRCK